MVIAISVVRPFHAAMMANALLKHADGTSICSSVPRKFFRGLDDSVKVRVIPASLLLLGEISKLKISSRWLQYDIAVWDRLVATMMPGTDVVIGFATQSLATGRAAHRRGARFVLDRACPHVDFQQELVRTESEKVGSRFEPEPAWYRERQIAEYEEADLIFAPSHYTADTFPADLRSKVVIAPLMGRASIPTDVKTTRNEIFTLGVVGGMPLRKGYLYLLQAWKKLALPNAKLLIRSFADFAQYPVLDEMLKTLPNIERVGYLADMADFYRRWFAFVLPSVDDGFGMVLFEAMANRVPTISTRNCGSSELITDGQDGLVIDARSVDQLAEAILKLYEDDNLRQSIAVAGQATAERVTRTSIYGDAMWARLSAFAPVGNPVPAVQ